MTSQYRVQEPILVAMVAVYFNEIWKSKKQNNVEIYNDIWFTINCCFWTIAEIFGKDWTKITCDLLGS